MDGFQRLQPSLQSVTALRYQRHFLREDGKCEFHGVVVPWERTWEEPLAQDGQTSTAVMPAESGKIAGYAAVIYQRVCPNQQPQSILHVGSQGTGFLRTKNSVTAGNYVAAQNLLETPVGQRPQWTEQVLQRLVDLAPTQDAAQKAVSAAKAELLQVMPQLQSRIQVQGEI